MWAALARALKLCLYSCLATWHASQQEVYTCGWDIRPDTGACCRDVWREAGIDVNTLYTEQRNGSGPQTRDLWVRPSALPCAVLTFPAVSKDKALACCKEQSGLHLLKGHTSAHCCRAPMTLHSSAFRQAVHEAIGVSCASAGTLAAEAGIALAAIGSKWWMCCRRRSGAQSLRGRRG